MSRRLDIVPQSGTFPSPQLRQVVQQVSRHLHRMMLREPWLGACDPDLPGRSCVWCAHTAADVFTAAGLHATVRPVILFVATVLPGAGIEHSVMIGKPGEAPHGPGRWNGHLVVMIEDAGSRFLYDPTLPQIRRPQWKDLADTMLVGVPTAVPPALFDLDRLTGCVPLVTLVNDSFATTSGASFGISWLDDPDNIGWRYSPDADPHRRARSVQRLMGKLR